MKSHLKFICYLGIIGIAITGMSCSGSTRNVEAKERTIEVTGSAEMNIEPNEFYISVTAQEYYDKGKKVSIEQIQKNLTVQFDSMGIKPEDVTIDSYSGYNYWWYWYYGRKDMLSSLELVVKLHDVKSVGKFMAELNSKGLTNVNIKERKHSDVEKLRMEVKRQAIENAKTKAEFLLGGLDKKLGEVIHIKEVELPQGNDYYLWTRVPTQLSNSSMGSSGDQMQSGDWGSSTINLRYEIITEFEIL